MLAKIELSLIPNYNLTHLIPQEELMSVYHTKVVPSADLLFKSSEHYIRSKD